MKYSYTNLKVFGNELESKFYKIGIVGNKKKDNQKPEYNATLEESI